MFNKIKSLFTRLIYNVKYHLFTIKHTWKLGSEFGDKYNRLPDERERTEMFVLIDKMWVRHACSNDRRNHD